MKSIKYPVNLISCVPAFMVLFIQWTSTQVVAAPITFNTALPVAKGAFINREQLILKAFKKDVSPNNRNLEVSGLISVLGYGVTPKLAIFGAMPYLDKTLDLDINQQKFTRSSKGFGDLKMFARYTFLQQDERSKTFRIAGFGGFKAPVGQKNQGDNLGRLPVPLQSGTGAWDYFGGVVLTYQTSDYQIDSQLSYDEKGSANHFEVGNEARADVSFQYRLSPQKLSSDTQSFVYGVLEANFVNQHNNRQFGVNDLNSGGTAFYLTPGIQYVTIKYILEAALQIPIVQNLHGTALESDYVFTSGFRINF